MPELHQRLVVQAQPWNATRFGSTHQRHGRRPERAALRVTDEFIARFRPVPAFAYGVAVPQLGGQQRIQQAQGEFTGLDPFLPLHIFVDHRIHAWSTVNAARLAERDVFTRGILQFDCHMLEHMPEPGTLAFLHAPDEAARLTIRTAVIGKARQGCNKCVDEGFAELHGRPLFHFLEVELEADDRKMRVQRRTNKNRAIENAHAEAPLETYNLETISAAALALRVCRLKVAPRVSMCNLRPSRQIG